MTTTPFAPGLIIAAPRSGAGKTTVSLGLMRALRRRGLAVQPFKCGPDYIDPAFHALAAGRRSFNLDTWAMRRELIAALIETSLLGEGVGRADIAIAEGVMGLFDGVSERGQSGRGSTADLALLTGWPVVLVIDVSGLSETAAAIALGCATYRGDIRVAGVILNRVASARQESQIAPAIERVGLRVLGSLSRRADLTLPERHLGLVQAHETADIEARLDGIADALESAVRVDDVVRLACPCTLCSEGSAAAGRLAPPGQRVALARDEAFSFVYPHILDGWHAQGAEIVPFSPLADEGPDASCDAVWLPGGYPELHAGTLSRASQFRKGLEYMAARSVPVHGECGGYMALGAGLEDEAGGRHAMAGLLGVETSFARRRLHLGYRRVRLVADSGLGPAGASVFGHEFHYASLLASPDDPLVDAEDASAAQVTERGSRRGTVTGTFFHVIDRAG
jgi:cobyrinic acid a,c-diamide synthase